MVSVVLINRCCEVAARLATPKEPRFATRDEGTKADPLRAVDRRTNTADGWIFMVTVVVVLLLNYSNSGSY